MTNIRLVYNPFTKEIHIYNERREITASENKIYTFLNSNSFYDCLLPLNKRYVIWEGLLPELLEEVNDEELHIVFEGRKADYQLLEEAFQQLKPAIENAGYENKWQLTYVRNFEAVDIVEQYVKVARSLRELCECRRELNEVDNLIAGIREDNLSESSTQIKAVISDHILKWEQSTNDYRQEKIMYLKMLEDSLGEGVESLQIK